MSDQAHDKAHEIALFRFGIIAPLVHEPAGSVSREIRKIAEQEYRIPYSTRSRLGAGTVYDWLVKYKAGGFEALKPKRRSDRKRPRKLDSEVMEILLSLKQEHPHWSTRMVIQQAHASGRVDAAVPLPRTTIHRLFEQEGLLVSPEQSLVHDRRRFAYERSNSLWQADVLHAMKVRTEQGTLRKTYLLAIIDDATRVVPYAQFAFSETARDFLTVFRQAVERRGIPQRLYVDNGSTFRSRQLDLVCAKLGTAILFAKPYQPAGKGKIERYLQRVRQQVLRGIDACHLQSLEALNRHFRAWVEGEYHRTPHHGLGGLTPFDKWAQCSTEIRVAESDLSDLFQFEVERKVKKDRTIQIENVIYEVEAVLVGETVTVRFDPSAPPERPRQVVYRGKPVGQATVVDLAANTRIKRQQPTQSIAFRKLEDPLDTEPDHV